MKRAEQLAGEIRREVSTLLLMEVRNPHLKRVTITEVRMTPDLREARIYYDWDGPVEGRAKIEAAFLRTAGFIRHTLAKKFSLRYAPQLRFYFDESRIIYDKASKIMNSPVF